MNPTVIKKFKTGSKKVEVNLVRWGSDDLGIQITDGSSNFTSFQVDDEHDGNMRGEFLASQFRSVCASK